MRYSLLCTVCTVDVRERGRRDRERKTVLPSGLFYIPKIASRAVRLCG